MIKASTTITVPFHDIDIMNIVWHGHYLKYFELARTKLMQKAGLDWPDLKELGFAMPVVDCQIKFRKPLTYGKVYEVTAEIREMDYPALEVHYQIFCQEAGQRMAQGKTRQTYLEIATMQSSFIVPELILQRLEKAKEQS